MANQLEERRAMISNAFRARYDRLPTTWTRAPGRVDLMGSHTDYNMGFVMTLAIDRDTWVAAAPREDNRVTIASLNVPGEGIFSLHNITHDEEAPWTNYVRGVARALQDKGHSLRGFDGLIHSTVPFGSGLSSSAAIEMAVATLLVALDDINISPVEMALAGQWAENEFVGVNTGILDQYSSVMGQGGSAILLDCRHLTSQPVAINPELTIIICNTRSERNLVGSEYDDRRAQCEEGVAVLQQVYPTITALRDVSLEMFNNHKHVLPAVVARRCQFILEENRRVLELAQVLPGGDARELSHLFTDSYYGARDLYEVGSPAMESMFRAMTAAPGIVSARQAGAGFGGSMVALVLNQDVESFCDDVTMRYREETGIQPEVYPVKASAGAGRLDFE